MSARWYKRCGADFIHGTMMLTLEEKGAYSLCLDLIYDRGEPIPDDARWLSGVCGVSIRKWNAIREHLLELGKLLTDGQYLSNSRADLELVSSKLQSEKLAESGAKGGRKRAENAGQTLKTNDLVQAPLKLIREEENREDSSEANASGSEAADPLKEMFNLGVAILTSTGVTEKQARSLIGKWRKSKGEAAVIQALIDARSKAVSNPVEWLEMRLKTSKWVSKSGYEYRGSDEDVLREADRRNDMDTYWSVKSHISNRAPPISREKFVTPALVTQARTEARMTHTNPGRA